MKVKYSISSKELQIESLRDGRDGLIELYRRAAVILKLPLWKRGLVYVFTGVVFETVRKVDENRWEVTFNFPLLDLMPRLMAAVLGSIADMLEKKHQ